MKNNPIDLVVTWVDGEDPVWLKERMVYEPANISSANCSSRFRDWKTLKYWFRGIEQNLDWYRYIFFVTYGHVPEWLNLSNPRLKVVCHKDFIPKEYLPTYNSSVIEMNLHRIEELSENFILFNDDVFVIDKVQEWQFFQNNLPCDMLMAKVMVNHDLSSLVWHSVFNNMGIINKYFSGGKNNVKNFSKWVNGKYGKHMVKNFLFMFLSRYSAFYDFHLAIPHNKSLFAELWEKENRLMDDFCNNKFRTALDINHWIFRYWRFASGNFVPINVSKFGQYYEFNENNLNDIARMIIEKRHSVVVLNDTGCEEQEQFEKCQREVIRALEAILPNKCLFEK